MSIQQQIKTLASKNKDYVLSLRHHIHSNPELSFQEYKTAEFVLSELKKLPLEITDSVAGTGIVALLKGNKKGTKILALRSELDALPIDEKNEIPYKSKKPGVMHACGHDVHTSSLLGTAKILSELRDQFSGTVKFIFQPGEEKLPGGASLMIKEGVLQNPVPSAILGQHVMPLLPVGTIGFRKGKYMASTDEIYITVKGKGGHAAMPEMGIDPVLITSHLIVALQQVVSRTSSPKIPSVLSFGKVIANGATNVIPDEVKIEGTFRTLDEKWREQAHKKIKDICMGLVESMGGKCELNIVKGYPVLENHPELTDRIRAFTSEYMDEKNIVDLDLWMASEDFAYYSHHVPACFYRIGVRNENKGIIHPVHSANFNVDEDVLELSSGLMAWLTICELNS